MNIPKVIDSVVNNDLCIGCGLCVYKCPNYAMEMKWNKLGFLIPELAGNCDSDGSCISVCPFNPFPEDEVRTENEIADRFLQENTQYHQKIGKYINIYAGYANEFRLTSSSGGVATFIFTELLERGIVDYIFSVKESYKDDVYYEYAVSSSKDELLKASKTKYYPVTLGTVMPIIHELNGKVAIVGVACFIKAIRLAQFKEPELKEKIPFLVGIICGGVKSRFFTEYLASKVGVKSGNYLKPQFRIKNLTSEANDYSFGCYDITKKQESILKMRTVGDMWGTGLFKAKACDFCDDIAVELADISLGDAWLKPYIKDGKGTNVIITRSSLADQLINEGVKKGKLNIEPIQANHFINSQKGSYNHRHKGLSYRIKQTKRLKVSIPPKRFDFQKAPIDFKIIQKLRMRIRQKSLLVWKNILDSELFDTKMKKEIKALRLITRIYHFKERLIKKIKGNR